MKNLTKMFLLAAVIFAAAGSVNCSEQNVAREDDSFSQDVYGFDVFSGWNNADFYTVIDPYADTRTLYNFVIREKKVYDLKTGEMKEWAKY